MSLIASRANDVCKTSFLSFVLHLRDFFNDIKFNYLKSETHLKSFPKQLQGPSGSGVFLEFQWVDRASARPLRVRPFCLDSFFFLWTIQNKKSC